MTKKQQQQAREIINATAPGRGAEDRRIAALRASGFRVEFHAHLWDFGTAGTSKAQPDGSLLSQLKCATGVANRKNGHVNNRCPVYRVSK